MEWRLRVYKIEAGRMEQWLEEWGAHIWPLRQRHGFELGGAWVADEESTFIWVLGYDGPDSWEVADRGYYASSERAAIEPNPARLIVKAEQWVVRPVRGGLTTPRSGGKRVPRAS